MAQFVETSIAIEGKSIKQFSALSIEQRIFDHHRFRITCPSEGIDGTSGSIFNASKDFVGKSITIQIKAINGDGTTQFSGVITQVEASRHSGHAGDISLSGFSPTILLDNGPHCKTWEKKAVKNIAQDVISNFPQNLLQPKISPVYGETLSYTVQYRETAWQFLSRLSATYGEWLFYDGQKLVLGSPQGPKAKLNFGSNLADFGMALQVRPATFKMMAYDYMNHEVYDGSPANTASKAGLNDFGKHVLQKSEKFYAAKPKQWHNQFLTNKKQLDDYVNTRAAMQSSNMVRFDGHSGHPGIQVGGVASVQGKNVFSGSDETFGDYHVISVNHQCDGQGNYSNQFIAIPSSIKMPPVTDAEEPRCETQSALVTDNHDPKGLGRIRVKFHWMSGNEKSPWLRMTSMHGGNGKGIFFIPEVDEEVIVGFEGDSPTKPYIIGTVYHSKAKTDFSNDKNDVKTIQTRSGNKIVMNDKEGSVFVEDKDGNSMKIDGDGNVNVLANKTIVLTCGDSKIEMKEDGTVNITGKKITVSADEKATMVSKQASFTADGNGGDAKIDGMNAKINGSVGVKVAGGATTEVSASGQVSVKGAMIMLN
jgi:type VI secretion system secreted protein VgrG